LGAHQGGGFDSSIKGREPAFSIDGDKSVRLSGKMADSMASDYLAHWVAHHPLDLIRHVQRINLHSDRAEPERLFAALVDLFIALGERGVALRGRMLDGARQLLGHERVKLLQRSLASGLTANHHLGDIPGSMLGHPVGGVFDVVTRSARPFVARSALEEARALVDEGHIDAAQSLLETALTDNPHDTELAEEVLLVYRATRNRQGYLRTRQMLEDADALPPAWRTADELADWSRA
jgi:hypothetical protein